MKPLRTGLAVGLLAGAVGAADKLVERLAGGHPRAGRRQGRHGARSATAPAEAVGQGRRHGASFQARRAAQGGRRPTGRPWVVAPTAGGTAWASPRRPARRARPVRRPPPAPGAPGKLPTSSRSSRRRPRRSAPRVGKYAVKQAGKAIGKAAADRVGKAIEVIEVLEKVVASVVRVVGQARPDTAAGPGVGGRRPPVAADLRRRPARPAAPKPRRPAPRPRRPGRAKPRGTLVSVRKFERGPTGRGRARRSTAADAGPRPRAAARSRPAGGVERGRR